MSQNTDIQKALHQFLISHMQEKEYKEKMNMIAEMEEYLSEIRDVLLAKHTPVHCEHCNHDSLAIEWTRRNEEKTYETNLNHNYNEDDNLVRIHSIFSYGICPVCGGEKFLREDIKEKTPISSFF